VSARNPDGAQRIGETNGNLIEAGIDLVGDAFRSAFSGGTRTPNARQTRALEAAGYELQRYTGPDSAPVDPPKSGKWIPVWYNATTGAQLSQTQARQLGRQLLRNPPATGGGGPSPADRPPTQASTGFPISWPFPIAIPGSLTATIPPWLRQIGRQNVPLAIALWLLQPLEAGLGSDLRDLYGAKPKGAPGRRGRRGRRRRSTAPPGRGDPWRPRPRPRPSAGGAGVRGLPGTGGGAVVMRRGSIVRSPPVVVAGVNMPPAPRSLPPAVKVDVGPIVAAPPRPIQQTVLQRAQGVLSNPLVRNALGAAAAAAFSAITAPGAAPRVGRVTLPGQSPVISPGSLPLTALNPGALQYRALNPALAQAQEQDCSCRPARK
jgi:hypothetical protein